MFSLSNWQIFKLPNSQTLLLLLYTLVLFFCFLLLTFPHDLLLERLEASLSRNTAVHLTHTEGRFAWWQGYEFKGAALHVGPRQTPVPSGLSPLGRSLSRAAGSDRNFPLLSFSHLFVRPRLHRLILGQPLPFRVYGELYGGSLQGEFWWQESLVHGFFTLRHIDLSRYRFPSPLTEVSVGGIISVEASFTGQASDLHTHRGEVTAVLQDGGVASGKVAGFSLPRLRFSQIRFRGRLEKSRVEIEEFVAQLDGLEVQGQGRIRLRTPLSRSLMDLRFSLETTAPLAPALRTLLALLPHSPDSPENRTLVISGTMGHPLLR